MQRKTSVLVLCALLVPGAAATAQAKPARKAPDPANVTLRGSASGDMEKKLRLENGAYVSSTTSLSAREASRNREKYILRATQAVEGGYDSVNIYDKGVLSWGLMQWTSHSGQLQDVLWYAKQRLLSKGQGKVWASLFKTHGFDVQSSGGVPTFHVLGPEGWRSLTTVEDFRILFRGTRTVDKFDPATVTRWSQVFARAGRHPSMQAIQEEWAIRLLRRCLSQPVDGKWIVSDFTRGDVFAEALTFALWTNNPAASREHFQQAVRQARQVTGEADPERWPSGLFPLLWEQVAANSRFGAWPRRTQMVARVITVGQGGRQEAYRQLASRGWRMDALRRGEARGQVWIPAPKTPPRAARTPLPRPTPEARPATPLFRPAQPTP